MSAQPCKLTAETREVMLVQAYAALLDRMPFRPHTPSAMLLQKLHGRLQLLEKILGRSDERGSPPALPLHHPAATA